MEGEAVVKENFMKIGILTFHCAHNYGAVLQCYALQETLLSMGHEVDVIDYRPEYLSAPYRVFVFNRYHDSSSFYIMKHLAEEIILLTKRMKRVKAFNSFIKENLHLSAEVEGRMISDKYDAYVIGSDQVWNAALTGGRFDPIYLADFQFDKSDKKYIAYAASMGKVRFPDSDSEQYFMNRLVAFDAVSVRESSLKDFIGGQAGLKADVVLDPTLLADSRIWDKIARKPNIHGKYVLVYQVGKSTDAVRIAEEIARQKGAEVIEMSSWMSPKFSRRKRQCASPSEFVGMVKHAECVVTTSFHGTAFSAIFRKPFYCVRQGGGVDSRSESLLRMLGLEDRLVDKDFNPIFEPVDYSGVEVALERERNMSLKFLKESL